MVNIEQYILNGKTFEYNKIYIRVFSKIQIFEVVYHTYGVDVIGQLY